MNGGATHPGPSAERCEACGADVVEPAADLHPARYLRCARCGFTFQPARSAAELHRLYDEDYFDRFAGGGDYSSDERQRDNEARVRLELLRRYLPPPAHLLEVGAAGGHFLARAAAAGYSGLGVEPVAELAEQARARPGVEVATGFLEDLDLPRRFDGAAAFHVLEHLPDPLGALRAIAAALRPGAVVVVEVPNVESFEARRAGPAWGALEPLHHVAHFGPAALEAILARAGLEVERLDTLPFYSYLRRARAIAPMHVAHRLALSARARVGVRGPHPDAHELLRAVARLGR